MKFIGLRLCEHDSNISYSNDITVKYYKSERDFQIKHHGFNNLTDWKFLIKKWNINPKDIDAIGIVLDCFRHKQIHCNEQKLFEIIDIDELKSIGFECPIFRIDHHLAHSLSIWPLNVPTTKNFVFDGFGNDRIFHSIFTDQRILSCPIKEEHLSFGQSLAKFGVEIGLDGIDLDHAGKIMALKGYSKSRTNNISYQKYSLDNLDDLWNTHQNFSIHDNFEEICCHVNNCHTKTEKIFTEHFSKFSKKNDIIGYTGGVAQNTVINSKLKKIRKNLQVPPHCNDEGLSLGIIEFLRQYFDQEKFKVDNFPFIQDDESPENKVSKDTVKKTAEFLAQGKIVGWYQGHGEIGPRALGNRSILMNPMVKNGKEILNKKVKHREFFRPFGASILEDKTSKYFDFDDKSEYMLYVMDVLDKKSFPAITHVDGTCRIQTVSKNLSTYHSLISEFEKITGLPMLLNTSLNNGGKPICGYIKDALKLFSKSNLDILVIGNQIYSK